MSQSLTVLDDVAYAGLSSWDAAPFLQKVTDIVPSIIYVFNQSTQSNEYSNRSLGSSLGYSASEIQEMGAGLMPRLCHPDDWSKVAAQFESLKSLADGEVLRVEYRMRHKMGFWVWLLSNDTVFDRDSAGQVIRHIGVASDITAQKAAEEQALAGHLKATNTNEELRAFSYAMSHDMKAPSNTLNLLLTELLETHRGDFQADAVDLVNMSLATARRMGTLVDDVLNYTRVVDQDLILKAVPLSRIIRDIVEDKKALIQSQNASVEIGELPVVRADENQMRILFANLIENALKFHPPGAKSLVWISSKETPDGTSAAIAVADNGIGIPAHKHQEVFTVFKRLNAVTDYAGSGLGLAICRRIASNHDSEIDLVSRPDQGATFTIGLKIA